MKICDTANIATSVQQTFIDLVRRTRTVGCCSCGYFGKDFRLFTIQQGRRVQAWRARPQIPCLMEVQDACPAGEPALRSSLSEMNSKGCSHSCCIPESSRAVAPVPLGFTLVWVCCEYAQFSYSSFIFLIYFLAVLGLRCCAWAFSSCGERRLLLAVASLVAEHGL